MKEHEVDYGKSDIYQEKENLDDNRPAAIMVIAPIIGAIFWVILIYWFFS